jgi:hypothetical protein
MVAAESDALLAEAVKLDALVVYRIVKPLIPEIRRATVARMTKITLLLVSRSA